MNYANISIVMYGIKKCSGSCLYCSAASTMDYRGKGNKNTFVFNPEKLKAKILEFNQVQLEEGKKSDGTSLNIDIWGGNPLENFDEFKQVVDFCEKNLTEFKFVSMHTSGNGLELRDNDIVDFLCNHKINYQLSHDGLGQWLRTGEIDPLTWEKTHDNIIRLVREGRLDWINCTLSSRNPSFFANIEFWNKWRKENDIEDAKITIKLNHIYDGTPPIEKKWLYKDNEQIKHGEVIGDLNFHGEVLQEYLHEFRKLAYILMTPGMENDKKWFPYVGYITEQAGRFRMIQNAREAGSCVAFQRGDTDKNFAIDTSGEYCQCNLIDSSSKVKNPGAKKPDYCKGCKYDKLAECNPCGSECFPEKCEFHWWWAKTLEETFQVRELSNAFRQNNNNHVCNCNQPKQRNNEPVYCIKNYTL